ncbi:hypothetical protein [Sandaracinus amylolyticus]|uniref:hypothetical protein n=1 Tax=Sandaracinus amylolyticus TaxID=927083 RepID=UPI001F3D2C60|nr:hypothetical protein [Sandaracinus amylolyticus]UJR83854.1 Hypothetical protein I5071_59250 [Sandaracinus amylolyticus]
MGNVFVAGALALALLVPSVAGAQLLDRASSTVRGDDGGGSSSSSSDDDDDDDDDDDGGLLDGASITVRGDGDSPSSTDAGWSAGTTWPDYALAPQPYASDCDAQLRPLAPGVDEGFELAVRADAEVGYALGGAWRGAVGVRLQLPMQLDLATRYSMFVEPHGGDIRFVVLGGFGIEYRLIDVPGAQLRIGAEARTFYDSIDTIWGGGATFGLDLFPGEPVVLSTELAAAFVGQAFELRARAQIGVLIESVEIFAGYHYDGLFRDGVHVDLGGPMLGVRAWL